MEVNKRIDPRETPESQMRNGVWSQHWLRLKRAIIVHSNDKPVEPVQGCSRTWPQIGLRGATRGPEEPTQQIRPTSYFLCRCRLRSFRCLCLRIFLRRFLMTLPTMISPCSAAKCGARPCLDTRSQHVNCESPSNVGHETELDATECADDP